MENNKMQRRYDLDWIRAIVVMSIIFYHVCDMFILSNDIIIFARSSTELIFCKYMQMFLARWHMVILFLISGMALFYSLKQRSAGSIMKTRVSKVLVPMVLGCVFLNPITSYLYGLSIGRKQSFIEQIILYFTSVSKNMEAMTTGFGPMHLWFLLYLFVFTLVCLPFFKGWAYKVRNKQNNRIIEFLTKPMMLLFICLPYPFLFWIFPFSGERNPIGYLYVFVMGFFFATDERIQRALDRDKYRYTLLSVVFLILYYYWEEACHFDTINEMYSIRGYVVKLVKLLISFSVLGISHTFIPAVKSSLLSFLNKISFQVYIVHMPIMTFMAYEIFKMDMNPYLQFVLILGMSYLMTIFICVIFNKGMDRVKGIRQRGKYS
ncbi:acyltransferase family protein [Paenibacillus sp. CGMCC 1.18879]|uniref:acyltransferase family protein n=1 Tax=Paenibacillus sp. CGMCC 1.18879 TaxID=2834466 RepID=UPI001CA93241|nr:acyltransferase [Paenibacillus sp. CGMCC 1.18879]MBY9079466.1 acyltransferase [Paenibacillus sp. CGMCC 1.18879]